jgi:phosphate transport system ATP-binding protein
MDNPAIDIRGLRVRYGQTAAVRDLDLAIARGTIHAIIGPARSGKTTVLRTLNLLSVDVDGAVAEGRIAVDGRDILCAGVDRPSLRRRVGMVFATPQPLPGSIRDNLLFGPRLAADRSRSDLAALVEASLHAAQLWDETKDRLDSPASALSGGQQQRLCIARTIALDPDIVLLDEPCSGLDPISTLKIEETMQSLRSRFTWVLVTNNTKQAARVSDRTAFLLAGELIEDAPTGRLFTAPVDRRTADYVEGRFG